MAKFFDAVSWIVIGMGLALCLQMGFKIYDAHKMREAYQQEEREKLKAKMKYHGTPMAFEERGKWYFIRNGEKCKL